jgi:NAD+ kinase
MQIAIYSRPKATPQLIQCANQLLHALHSVGAKVHWHAPFYAIIKNELTHLHPPTTFDDIATHPFDCLITLGGDGTILDAVSLVKQSGVPVLGINLGRLGFLAAIAPNQIHTAVEQLIAQNYTTDRRSLLHITANKPIFQNFPFALNECTIQKRDTSSMITIHTYIDNEFLNSYWADGLIVATPTGSTGYNMSCGGPILLPSAQNLIITPIAAHNLNVRPIALPDTAILRFEVENRDKNLLLTIDSRTQIIDNSFEINIEKSTFTFNLIRFNNETFINALRSKLSWGIDRRNE